LSMGILYFEGPEYKIRGQETGYVPIFFPRGFV